MASGLLSLITFYQRYLSAGHPACCRFSPTCSAYAAQAIRRHGAIRGTGLAIWRVFRCNPFCRGGYDPVPEKPIHNSTVKLPREQRGRLIGITRKQII
ncbi:MAG: membrane protein insertion efficiency factor YidD [Clostridiaceae bacterium]|nr:membrane protein insertion efficiency factor YidD [Clostridiaceae bacterium]